MGQLRRDIAATEARRPPSPMPGPRLAIFVMVLALNLVGDILRNLSPRGHAPPERNAPDIRRPHS